MFEDYSSNETSQINNLPNSITYQVTQSANKPTVSKDDETNEAKIEDQEAQELDETSNKTETDETINTNETNTSENGQ